MSAALLETSESFSDETACGLHGGNRDWPLTNCYVDVWVELLWFWGRDPTDMFAFCVTQDFEGDHFTFFKPPTGDLEELHGVRLEELPVWDDLERHIRIQTRRDRVALVEVDGFLLPDTRATSYRREHTKTTIGIVDLDPDRQWCRYVHNAGVHEVSGEDYLAMLRPPRANGLPLFPYSEITWQGSIPERSDVRAVPRRLLTRHLARRPTRDPIEAFQAAWPDVVDRMIAIGPEAFHGVAFNTVRQLGSCHAFLGDFLRWLADGTTPADTALRVAAAACVEISGAAKRLQLRAARMSARGRFDPCDDAFSALRDARDRLHRQLDLLHG